MLFPDATVQTSSFVNNVVDPALASADIINNVDVQASTSVSFAAQEMTASAEILEPLVAVNPMNASATMPNATGSVTPNYLALVLSKSPIFYVENGGKNANAINRGSGNFGTGVWESGITGSVVSGEQLSAINNGLGWAANIASSASLQQVVYTNASAKSAMTTLHQNGNFTYEFWLKPQVAMSGSAWNNTSANAMWLLDTNYFKVRWARRDLDPGVTNDYANVLEILYQGQTATIRNDSLSDGFDDTFNWKHLVITGENTGTGQSIKVYLNSSYAGGAGFNFTIDATPVDGFQLFPGSTWGVPWASYFDELAIYPKALSQSEIIDNYSFVINASPDRTINPSPFTASIDSGDHNFVVSSNINYPGMTATASALIVDPLITGQKTINISVDPMLVSAANTDVEVYWGWTIVATPMISAAESKEGFVLNDIYYNYVQTNIAPYRHVTFDAVDTTADYGTDNDYSVVPTVVGGTIINPDLGINGKSAKTAGTSYITDGVILKESEWNDSWGTGQNSYHSAFWFQRALDDASTTGLRVLWNLNGYKDNQHIVLYQYQNKLHLQFNNGSGTWIEQDTGTLDLFDYNRHFVVINFNHTNPVNNIVTVYVDSVLKMTIDLGAYTGSTTNASSADSGPNDEANNHPRLSVGCLITPFAATALPVVPTNTKLIIDEIYWDKNATNQTQITNLFNIMPDKNNVDFTAEAMTASDDFVMPAYATSSNLSADPFTASVELVGPLTTADREVIYISETMTANAEIVNALRIDSAQIVSDVMFAVSTFNNAGAIISIPGGPMLASAKIPANIGFKYYDEDGDYVTTYPLSENLTPLVRYIRVDALNSSIPNLVEVK